MPKTWFQHDINSRTKDGIHNLIEVGGMAAYGQFWALTEHVLLMQLSRQIVDNKVRINENTLKKVLKTNSKRLPILLKTFQECLGIVCETFLEPFGNVYEIALPNLLDYIGKRSQVQGVTKEEIEVNKKEIPKKLPQPKVKDFPKEFIATDTHIELAGKHGKSLQNEMERFRDYCLSKPKKYANYDLAFNNWLKNDWGK